MPSILFDEAKAYLNLGFRPIPIINDRGTKRPAVEFKELKTHGSYDSAFSDLFKDRECDAIATIVNPEEIVIDIDSNPEAWERLLKIDTPILKTPRGYHLHFKRPTSLKMSGESKNLHNGLEIKASGALAAIHGMHPDGVQYEWIKHPKDTPLADMPGHLIDLLNNALEDQGRDGKKLSEQEISRLLKGLSEGEGRNNACMILGGHYIGKGLAWPEIETILIDWNNRNKPPMEDQELSNCLKSLEKMYDSRQEEKKEKGQDSSRFFDEKGSLKVKSLSNALLEKYHFFALSDTLETYVYKNGVFVPEAERLISTEVQALLGEKSKKHYQAEILNYIQHETLISRNDIYRGSRFINLMNGVYDRESKVLLPHDPKYRFITQIPVFFDINATCPAIEKFMQDVLKPDDVGVIYEFIGYCLIPDTTVQKAVMLIGKGQNGKSKLLSLIGSFIGLNNTSRESLHSLEKDPYSTAELHGKLVNIFPDLADQSLYDNQCFKMLTGDEDQVRARKIYCEPFRFKNTARLIFSANHVPPVPRGDYAYFRRWILLEFPNQFEGSKKDPNILEKITTERELSGLLNIVLKSLDDLTQGGEYSYKLTTAEVEKMYRINSDPVAVFADECLTMSTEHTPKEVIYEYFVKWCVLKEIDVKHYNIFCGRMKKLGFEEIREREGENRTLCFKSCVVRVANEYPDLKKQYTPAVWSGGQGTNSHCDEIQQGNIPNIPVIQHIENYPDLTNGFVYLNKDVDSGCVSGQGISSTLTGHPDPCKKVAKCKEIRVNPEFFMRISQEWQIQSKASVNSSNLEKFLTYALMRYSQAGTQTSREELADFAKHYFKLNNAFETDIIVHTPETARAAIAEMMKEA